MSTHWLENVRQMVAVTHFLGLRFHGHDLATATSAVVELIAASTFSYVVTPNVDHMVQLHGAMPDSQQMWAAFRGAAIRLCDSRILSLIGRASGVRLSVVPGSDLLASLTKSQLPAGTKVILVGGDEYQRDWLQKQWENADIILHQPPFGLRYDHEAQVAVVKFIHENEPNLVLFTVGAPQSELIASLVQTEAKFGGVGLCVGAALEFLTGTKRRAPKILQRLHLEWAFRLISEPRRLWRRYLERGPRILAVWWRWRQNSVAPSQE